MNTRERDLYIVKLLGEKVEGKDSSLNLSYERLGDSGVAFLARAKNLSHVTHLDLSWNEITDVGVQELAKATSLTNLLSLNLDSNRIGCNRFIFPA